MQKAMSSMVAVAAVALAASTTLAQSFQISIGVRETGTTEPVGGNGGSANGIEWINLDGQILNIDGTWQQFVFNFGTDPVNAFAGATANGTLEGTRGTLEHIRVRNSSGITEDINLWIDDVVNTVGGSPTELSGFESPFTVGQEVMFQEPRFSGSTSANLALAPNTAAVDDTQAKTGTQSYKSSFAFNSANTAGWIRMTTLGAGGMLLPNVAIDFTAGNQLSFWMRAETALPSVRWVGAASGLWSEPSNWNGGVIAGVGAGDAVNFLADPTVPVTVTLDFPALLNSIRFENTNSYTIESNDPANNHLSMTSTSTFTPAAIDVVTGSHRIDAPIRLDLRSLQVTVAEAASVLTISSEINFDSTNSGTIANSLVKNGPGRLDTARVVSLGGINVGAGTLRLAQPSSGPGVASNVATLAIAGTAVAPTAKLDLTNNGLVINYATTSPLADTVSRIAAARATGDWSGNGITSSLASATNGFGVGVAEAAALGATEFMGQTVDATAVLVRFTRLGDANLNGTVNLDDFTSLANGFGVGTRWDQGDFNYDGVVNLDDFTFLAANFGTSVPADLGRSAVPEPTGLAALGLAAAGLLARRWRA